MLFHIFGHIEPYHKLFVAEHTFGKRFGKVGFTHARGSYEYERAYGFGRLGKSRAGAADSPRNRADRLVLTYYAFMKVLFEVQKLFTLLLGKLDDWNARPAAYNFGYLFAAYLGRRGMAFALPVAVELFDLLVQAVNLVDELLRLRIILALSRLVLFEVQPLYLFFELLDLFGGVKAVQSRTRSRLVNQVDCLVGKISVGNISVG